MSMVHEGMTWLKPKTAWKRYAPDLIWRCWNAYLERRKHRKLAAALADLSDRELTDIGTTRSEIDYVASHRAADPRGIWSAEWMRHLPTVDGQVGSFPTDFR